MSNHAEPSSGGGNQRQDNRRSLRADAPPYVPQPRVTPTINDVPDDVLAQILARVASHSLRDLANARLSCRRFNRVAEHPIVYANANIQPFYTCDWSNFSSEAQNFFQRCELCNNPEIFYRRGLYEYFSGVDVESGVRNLNKAISLGHSGAGYAACIAMLFSADPQVMQRGINYLGMAKMNPLSRRFVEAERNKMLDILQQMFVNNPFLRHNHESICATAHCNLPSAERAGTVWEGEEYDTNCLECCAYDEMRRFCRIFPAFGH